MAKYRRYRKYSRRSHAKWSPNIQEIATTTVTAPRNSTFYQTFVLSFNPTQVNTAVSQIYTVKRIECSFYIDSDIGTYPQDIEDVAAYIMFVPQGMNVTQNYNVQHPEYIMAYKFLGSPTFDTASSTSNVHGQQYQPTRVNTRLSRKLNSGDSVILFIKGNNTNESRDTTFDFHGLIRWWTKAN